MVKPIIALVGGLAAPAVFAQPSPQPTQSPGAPPNCIFDSQRGATYDLAPMYNSFGYTIYDTNGKTLPTDPQYAIRFALCTNIDPVAASIPQCASTTGSDGSVMTGPAAAFRYCTSNCNQTSAVQCQRLGGNAWNQTQLQPFSWNPAHGVSVTFWGGDACQEPFGTFGSALQLDLQCTDRGGIINRQVDIIPDGAGCFWNVMFTSDAACPLECPVVTQAPNVIKRLCGGHGICDYDRSAQKARCFCNEGWSGTDCMSQGDKGVPPAPSYAGSIAGGFIGGLLGGAALLVAGLFGRAKMTGAPSFVDAISFGSLVGPSSGGGSSGAAASALGAFGSDAGVTGMDAAYAGLGGAGDGAMFTGGSSGYVAPDLAAPSAGLSGDGPLLA